MDGRDHSFPPPSLQLSDDDEDGVAVDNSQLNEEDDEDDPADLPSTRRPALDAFLDAVIAQQSSTSREPIAQPPVSCESTRDTSRFPVVEAMVVLTPSCSEGEEEEGGDLFFDPHDLESVFAKLNDNA